MTERLRGVASNLGAEGSREASEEAVQASGENPRRIDLVSWSVKVRGLENPSAMFSGVLSICGFPDRNHPLSQDSGSLRRKSWTEVGAAKIGVEVDQMVRHATFRQLNVG